MPSVTAALDGRVVAVEGVFGHRVDADVGAGQRARDGDPHRGAVGRGETFTSPVWVATVSTWRSVTSPANS